LRAAEGNCTDRCAPADGGGHSELLRGLMQWVAENKTGGPRLAAGGAGRFWAEKTSEG
jgi:hypothetical protein